MTKYLSEDPSIPRGLGSQLFNGEGLAAKRRTILEKGVLRTYFIDIFCGRKLGMEPTPGGASNWGFLYRGKSSNKSIKGVSRGIFVTGFMGGNSNDTAGDLSFGISGMFIENGALVRPVYEMNASGNMKDFWNEPIEIGNDPHVHSGLRTPTLRFRNVQFSGT